MLIFNGEDVADATFESFSKSMSDCALAWFNELLADVPIKFSGIEFIKKFRFLI
jgi:hypothetical protein